METIALVKKGTDQVIKTVNFEAQRNLKKMIMMIVLSSLFFVLSVYLQTLRNSDPEKAIDYISSYLGMIDFLILIIALTLGSSMIVEDFEKQTGNLLFPKIEKSRLLIGRYITRWTYGVIAIFIFYTEIAIITYSKYDTLPSTIWNSFGWAILYYHLILSLVVFVSSILNRVATTSVMTLFLVLMVFQIVGSILVFSEVKTEPLFLPTYYANIISASLEMPTERFRDISAAMMGIRGPGLDERVFRQWVTPSETGGFWGIVIYSVILLGSAYFIYRRKQSKE